ncbi:MAG: outer membrane beta-barrel protein [Campylobacterota bacterium]|nr:outer membrane beta-barrel protein [Campylobacterota bacterium]
MNKFIISITTIIALSTTSFAGGKFIAPATVPVVPIPSIVNPLPLYIGLGLVAVSLDRDSCACGESESKDIRYGSMLRVGWDFSHYIGIEARMLKTLEDNVFSETTHYGLYLKPQYHVTSQINVYALLGYGKTTVDYTNGVRASKTDEDGFSYGAGVEYDFSTDESLGTYSRIFDGQGDQEEGWGLWLDVQHLLKNDGAVHTTSNILTIGITYDF